MNPAENAPPAAKGTKRMLEILTNICEGRGKEGDIELLEEMAHVIKDSDTLRSRTDGAQSRAEHDSLL